MKKTELGVIITSAILMVASSSASAALAYDQNVNGNGPATPVPSNGLGMYYGTGGNLNGGWTVNIDNNIELGLRAHVRYPSPENTFNSAGNGVYSFTDGLGNGPVGENRSSWNYDFSINANQSGLGSGLLSDFTFSLAIDSDPGAGQSFSLFDPLSIPDNGLAANTLAGNNIAQNSENARFPIVGVPGYDNTIAGTYDFVLSAYDSTGALKAQTYARVNVNGGTATGPLTSAPSVPDAGSTLALMGAAFVGIAGLRRKFNA